MTLMLDLPETTMRWLQSEAAANGKDPAAFVGEQLAEVRALRRGAVYLEWTLSFSRRGRPAVSR